MEKRQKSLDGAQKSLDGAPDRLSELADSLILEILSFLKMREVVVTTLLSKRWKGLWTAVRCLYFDESEEKTVGSSSNYSSNYCSYCRSTTHNTNKCPERNESRSRNFINRALMLWKGTKIPKFKVILGRDLANRLSYDMNLWVHFATAREVEELYLHLPSVQYDKLYRPPQCLYSCSSISKLTLIGCVLDVRGNLQWDRLKSFTLHASCIDDDDLIGRVVSAAPRLENFELHLLRHYGNFRIESTSLKKLLILKHFDVNSGKNDKSLTIWAPKLEALILSRAAYNECLLMDVPSLTDATLDFKDNSREVELTLQQILPAIQHVGAIRLSAPCIEMMMNGVVNGIMFDAKMVRASAAPIELEPKHIVGLLLFFPMLKRLIIDMKSSPKKDNRESLKYYSEAHTPKALLWLTTVEITWHSYEASMFQFIEFLLKRAAMLEKIVIKKGKAAKAEDMFLVAKELMRLQKSFPTVALILDSE